MDTSAPKAVQAKREMTWRDRLTRHAASGLGVAAFCKYESISTASFYRWRTLLAGQTETVADVAPAAGFSEQNCSPEETANYAASPTIEGRTGAHLNPLRGIIRESALRRRARRPHA